MPGDGLPVERRVLRQGGRLAEPVHQQRVHPFLQRPDPPGMAGISIAIYRGGHLKMQHTVDPARLEARKGEQSRQAHETPVAM